MYERNQRTHLPNYINIKYKIHAARNQSNEYTLEAERKMVSGWKDKETTWCC